MNIYNAIVLVLYFPRNIVSAYMQFTIHAYTAHNNTIVVFSAAQFHMRCLFRCEIFISTHFPFLIDYCYEFGDMNVWNQPMNIGSTTPCCINSVLQ